MRPFASSLMITPSILIGRPVAGMPSNSPCWVPVSVTRVQTFWPSPIWSVTSTRISGNAVRSAVMKARKPSTPTISSVGES